MKNEILIVLNSVTYAEKGKRLLAGYGITSKIVKPSSFINNGGCSFGLAVSGNSAGKAIDLLKDNGFRIKRTQNYNG